MKASVSHQATFNSLASHAAVGALLFHVATGRYPVDGASVRELRAAHEAHARTDLASLRPDCSAALVAVVERR
jgi:hypothetical protein